LVTNLRGLRLGSLLAHGQKGVFDPAYGRFMDATHAVLFGDPAMRPFKKGKRRLVECSTEVIEGGLKATLDLTGCGCHEAGFLTFWQYYPNWLDWRTKSVYCAVPLPADADAASEVSAEESTGIALGKPIFLAEKREDRRILHVVVPVPLGTLERMGDFARNDHEIVLTIRTGRPPKAAGSILEPADDALRKIEIDLKEGGWALRMRPGRLTVKQKETCSRIIDECTNSLASGGRRTDLFLCFRGTAFYLLGEKDEARRDFSICFKNPTLREINFLGGKPREWAASLGIPGIRSKGR